MFVRHQTFDCIIVCLCINIWSTTVSDAQSDGDTFAWNHFVQTSNKNFEAVFLPNYVNLTEDLLGNSLVSGQCSAQVRLALSALKFRQSWAVKLFNSWGKFLPSGWLRGTLTDFGDYDQCLSVDSVHDDDGQVALRPQYCLVDLSVPMPRPMPVQHNLFHHSSVLPQTEAQFAQLPPESVQHLSNGSVYRDLAHISSIFYYSYIQIGICLPSKCENPDIRAFLDASFQKYGLRLSKFSCSQTNQSPLNKVQITAAAFLVTVLLITLIASIYDAFWCGNSSNTEKSPEYSWLRWFSPQKNIYKLLYCRFKSEDELGCIHGLRVVTICLVIVGHALVWNNINIFKETFTLRNRLTEILPQVIYGSQLTVDTFFFLSGLLTTYVTIKFTQGDYNNFDSWMFIVLRYLRLTPQLVAFILLSFLVPILYDGPIWRSHISVVDKCYANWWHNLLYLQNVIDIENICAVHTWYLAVDMQLHWLSFIPMVLLLKHRKVGLALCRALIGVCIAVAAVMIFYKRLPPGAIRTSHSDFLDENGMPSEYLAFVYKPWLHSFVFFIGFLFGDYIVHNPKRLQKICLKTSTKYLLWCVSLSGFLFSIYGTYPWLHGRAYNPVVSAVVYPLTLLTWTGGLALAIWLCVTNNGGVIGVFLSYFQFRPLSRMTYSVYLTHVWVVWASNGSRRDLISLDLHSLLIYCAGIILCAFFVGFAFTVLFESPLINALEYWKHTLIANRRFRSDAVATGKSCSAIAHVGKGEMSLFEVKPLQ